MKQGSTPTRPDEKTTGHSGTSCRLVCTLLAICSLVLTAGEARAIKTLANIDTVRERGQSVPPFLNPGVKANLLLLLDNSGSMLDMAYTDTTAANDYCYDASFNSANAYVGYFDENSWYRWDSDGATFWQPATSYNHGALVFDNGILYRATCSGGAGTSCTSGTTSLLDDASITWSPLVGGAGFASWQQSTVYNDGDVLYDHNILYQVNCVQGNATTSSCSSGTTSLTADNSLSRALWTVNATGIPTWSTGMSIANGQHVYNPADYTVYQATCKSGTTCSTSGIAMSVSTTVNWSKVANLWWPDTSYTTGSSAFDLSTSTLYTVECRQGPNAAPTCISGTSPGADNALTAITYKTISDGQFKVITDGSQCSGATYSNTSVCVTPDEASTPNGVTVFAATGKFLNWLSASKFDIEKQILTGGKYNENAGLLISEHRGCAGKGYLKDTEVRGTAGTKVLSFMVRGPIADNDDKEKNDQIAADDTTTRIAILGLTDDSIFNGDCKAAIDGILSGANLNSLSNSINNCLTPLRTTESSELGDQRPMLNHALQFCQKYFADGSRNLNAATNECEKLYDKYLPSQISPYYGAYACFGIYDANVPDETKRTGFIGRCWNAGTSADGTCTPKPATTDCPLGASATSCEYLNGDGLYRNYRPTVGDPAYNYLCTKTKTAKGKTTCSKETYWQLIYTDGTTTYTGDPTCGASSSAATGWDSADTATCIEQGMEDYCDGLAIPEVIDPSDQATTTSEFWNTPATLIDSGIVVALGTDRPLAVLRGHIQQDKAPIGVLQRKAQDLRIGAMKFNAVGADFECTTSSAADSSVVQKFCPPDNEDGSRLISPLQLGSSTDSDGNLHIDNVAQAINEVQANTWTPLAEAYFNAIGYFSQRSDMCVNKDAGGNCLDFPISEADDPVQEACQPNHILLITEGASTADIASQVTSFAANHGDGDSDDGICANGLEGSTYLDDLTDFGYYFKPTEEDFTNLSDYASALAQAETEGISLYGGIENAFIDGEVKEGIQVHIITSGSLRDEGSGECNPANLIDSAAKAGGSSGYIAGENPASFEKGLETIFESILERASAGSAASVISSSRSGEGAVYQAIFWPELTRTDAGGNFHSISWVGEVHSLFIDASGNLYEDTNGDGRLNPSKDIDNDGKVDVNEDLDGDLWLDIDESTDVDCDGKLDHAEDIDGDGFLDVAEGNWTASTKGDDRRVTIYYDAELNKSMGCYRFQYQKAGSADSCAKVFKCVDRVGLDEVKYIWSANNWLADLPDDSSLLTNRSDINVSTDSDYISADKKRNIFTWNDKNNNGKVDRPDEILPFEASVNWDQALGATMQRGSMSNDFGLLSDGDVGALINWMRGHDTPGVFRKRTIPEADNSDTLKYWRLGDVINSTPMTVSSPQEAFNLLYNDSSYAKFAAQYNTRRHVVYFGANDGMLHAVNGGFYNESKKMFCRTETCEINETTGAENNTSATPELGAELWAYVPYNLLPHLEFLADPSYIHKYYVDLRPRIFDVQIFTPDSDHPEGWGTILVGGMRFGGAPVQAQELNLLKIDNRVFASSYFIFDITNPEKPPILLGELTRTSEDVNFDGILTASGEDDDGDGVLDSTGTDLGYSTAIPTMIIMKKGGEGVNSANNRWYLTLGSGPHSYYTSTDSTGSRALKGFSDQNAKVAILPLQRLIDAAGDARITDAPPTADSSGRYLLTDSANGFVSDLITIDFDIAPSTDSYMSDAVYFGTVEANSTGNGGFAYDATGKSFWDGGGKVYRLRTRNLFAEWSDASLFVQNQSSSLLGAEQQITIPEDWQPTIFFNPEQPVTAAPSAAYDGRNFWIYFGTGRFFDADDKTDDTQQSYYGIKEPLVNTLWSAHNVLKFTWDQVQKTGSSGNDSGSKGLLKVDEILVAESTSPYTAELSCIDLSSVGAVLDSGATTCLPAELQGANARFDSSTGPSLVNYIGGDGTCSSPDYENCVDGWYKDFHEIEPFHYRNRERNLGQATVLGGLVTFTTYQPYSEPCLAEGISHLYGVYYGTGTAWHQNVFGQNGVDVQGNVKDKLVLGRGLSTTANLHIGSNNEGAKAFIQTSTGEIKEIQQNNLPIDNYKTGLEGWREYEKP
ncbi:MAG: PilC/PilY family type IV pilus protein [Desulfopila sp.]